MVVVVVVVVAAAAALALVMVLVRVLLVPLPPTAVGPMCIPAPGCGLKHAVWAARFASRGVECRQVYCTEPEILCSIRWMIFYPGVDQHITVEEVRLLLIVHRLALVNSGYISSTHAEWRGV